PASFPERFLPPPVTDSGKTGHVRTTTLPSSSPSPSQSRSAVVVAGNRHETGRFGQFLTEFYGARSPSSGHRFRRVRLESSFHSFSRPVLHAAARVVQEMGKSRAAAFSLGIQDIDETVHFNTF
ncbi:unnamed protein product, partial [Prunus brigantina]